MGTIGKRTRNLLEDLLPQWRGAGPLLQRDYWAVIENCRLDPHGVAGLVASRFWDFAPEHLVVFRRADGTEEPLEVGDEMTVRIRMAGTFRVRVVHKDRNSLTVATLVGHPEAGRITFGAYRNEYGDVVFHIRSLARSGSAPFYLGFLALGEAMQTETWADFVNRVALTVGDGVLAYVHADRRELPARAAEADDPRSPTFLARGD